MPEDDEHRPIIREVLGQIKRLDAALAQHDEHFFGQVRQFGQVVFHAHLARNAGLPSVTIAPGDYEVASNGSNTILNLNEPTRIDDTSWIKPGKYTGIWWSPSRNVVSRSPEK